MSWMIATDYQILDWVILTLLILTAFLTVRLSNLLASAMMLAIFSLLTGFLYLLLDAPDVALTEAAVGAGISTVLFLGAMAFTPREEKRMPWQSRIVPFTVSCLMGGALVYATFGLPPFSSPDNPIHSHVAPYYLQNMPQDIGIPNLVTAILASYRGFDTMGEVAVVFTAGIAIVGLLMNLPKRAETLAADGERPEPKTHTVSTPIRERTPRRKPIKKKGSA